MQPRTNTFDAALGAPEGTHTLLYAALASQRVTQDSCRGDAAVTKDGNDLARDMLRKLPHTYTQATVRDIGRTRLNTHQNGTQLGR